MTDIALDEKALSAALEAWEHGVGFHWDDVQRAIRAYLRASPSQVAPQPQAGEAGDDAVSLSSQKPESHLERMGRP